MFAWRSNQNGRVVAFNMRPARGPWGGSSPFVEQLAELLRRRGYRVVYTLADPVDLIVMVDPRVGEIKPFGIDEIEAYRRSHPGVRVLHRINECDQRKGTEFMDPLLARANAVADFTVFISEWLRDYHAARWFDTASPHAVIYNGADPAVFHPIGSAVYDGRGPLRLVTHHWSAHPLKGFDVYAGLDRALAAGEIPDTELWVIGNWPEDLRWQAARTFAPSRGRELAALLRRCHGYVTASRWEPCGMHHVEGAQCGLPLLYHRDGGGIVEAGERYGLGFDTDLAGAIEVLRADYRELRARVLERMPSGDRMALDYADIIQRLLTNQAPQS